MKCAVFLGPGRIEIQQREKPVPRADEILVRVKACGICGSDLHVFTGRWKIETMPVPVVLGHEFSGQVEQVGEFVTLVKPGDRVAVEPNVECGICHFCREGKPRQCLNKTGYGVWLDGGFAEYCVVKEQNIYPIKDALSYKEAAFTEPLSIVIHGMQLAGVDRPGLSFVAIGGGTSGFLYIQLAKAWGCCPVVLVTRSPWKHNVARSLGADQTINPEKQDVRKMLHSLTDGLGADIVVEAVGKKETVVEAICLVKAGGRVIVHGVTGQEDTIPLRPFQLYKKEFWITGVLLNPFTSQRAVEVLEKGVLDVKPLITHEYPLDDIADALETMRQNPPGFIKAVILP